MEKLTHRRRDPAPARGGRTEIGGPVPPTRETWPPRPAKPARARRSGRRAVDETLERETDK